MELMEMGSSYEPMTVEYNNIPDNWFIEAFLERDIRIARLVPYKERIPGEPDIIVSSILGNTENIFRKSLVKDFRYTNGRRIRLGAWKEGREVIIMSNGPREKYYVAFVPGRCTVNFSGKLKKSKDGMYIVLGCDELGNLDRTDVRVINSSIFRKIFKIYGDIEAQKEEAKAKATARKRKTAAARSRSMPYDMGDMGAEQDFNYPDQDFGYQEHGQDYVEDNEPISRGILDMLDSMETPESRTIGNTFEPDGLYGRDGYRTPMDYDYGREYTSETDRIPRNDYPVNLSKPDEPSRPSIDLNKPERPSRFTDIDSILSSNMSTSQRESKTAKRYTVIGKCEHEGQIVGFKILDRQTGREGKLSISSVKELAEKKLIDNIVLVENKGVQYIRGNGIKITDLPSIMV